MAHGDVVYCGATSDVVEDWSHVRSPARAMRRHGQGHRQYVWHFEVRKDGTPLWPLSQTLRRPKLPKALRRARRAMARAGE